jgi:2,4-dienoyl-CoA reductase-like NADH-dependent reductase (Old Yellow Enzyme family)
MTSVLFSPTTLRELEFPNRIVVAPMCQFSAENGLADDWHLMHLGSLAVSGVGLMIAEATGVEAQGRITPGCLGLYNDEQEEALDRGIRFCRRHGEAKIALQLAHAGRKASTAVPWNGSGPLDPSAGAWQTISASPLPFADGWPTPSPMSLTDMDRVRDAFVQAAERAARLDFDVIELHAAHGYLLNQFLSPIANHRDDEYGGSLENRMRYPLDVFAAVRAVWPEGKPLGIRISATDWQEPGWTIEESVVLAGELKALGCDFIDVSSGGNSASQPPVANAEQGYQVPLSAQIKAEAEIPTIAVGMIRDPQYAEDVVASGKADFVALARGLLYETHWAWRAAEELGAEAPYPRQYIRAQPKNWPNAFPGRSET